MSEGLAMIADYPKLGRARPQLKPELRSLPVGDHHIFYRFDGEAVLVARVLHKAMDAGQHL